MSIGYVENVAYGGHIDVSRKDIDFNQPNVLDIIINELIACDTKNVGRG